VPPPPRPARVSIPFSRLPDIRQAWRGDLASQLGSVTGLAASEANERIPMYIGIGTVVLIIIIVLVVLMLRRRV
jgi:hypothetical protein